MLYASYWQWTEWIETTNEHDLLRLLMQQHIMDYLYSVLYINQLNYLEKKSLNFFAHAAANFERLLLYVCLSATLMLNISETKRFSGSCKIGSL